MYKQRLKESRLIIMRNLWHAKQVSSVVIALLILFFNLILLNHLVSNRTSEKSIRRTIEQFGSHLKAGLSIKCVERKERKKH